MEVSIWSGYKLPSLINIFINMFYYVAYLSNKYTFLQKSRPKFSNNIMVFIHFDEKNNLFSLQYSNPWVGKFKVNKNKGSVN